MRGLLLTGKQEQREGPEAGRGDRGVEPVHPCRAWQVRCAVKLAARKRFEQVVETDILPRLQRLDPRRGFRPRPVDGRLQPLFNLLRLGPQDREDQGDQGQDQHHVKVFSGRLPVPLRRRRGRGRSGARLLGAGIRPRPALCRLVRAAAAPDPSLLEGLGAARARALRAHTPGRSQPRRHAPAQAPSRPSCILGSAPTVPPGRLGSTASGHSRTETRSPSLSPPGLTLVSALGEGILGQSRRAGRANQHIPITRSNPAAYLVPASTSRFTSRGEPRGPIYLSIQTKLRTQVAAPRLASLTEPGRRRRMNPTPWTYSPI